MSEKQERHVKTLTALIPKGVTCEVPYPETSRQASEYIDAVKLIALPLPSQWAKLNQRAKDFGFMHKMDDAAFRATLTVQVCENAIDVIDRKAPTEAMLTRLATLEDRAFDGKLSDHTNLRAGECYDREYRAALRIEERGVMEQFELGLDPGADAQNHATAGTDDEVEPVSEGSSVNRRKR